MLSKLVACVVHKPERGKEIEMTILIVHTGTQTIIDASDDVLVIDTDELTAEEREALEDYDDTDAVEEKGTDIMKIIRYYTGEKKGR